MQLPNGRYTIRNSVTAAKDQTYALYNLTQDQLSRTLMPVGDYDKPHIRQIAEEIGLPVATKHDSQDICFVPDHDYASFITQETGKESKPGNFVDEEGNIMGQHRGLIHYTIGQRKGLGISSSTLFLSGNFVRRQTKSCFASPRVCFLVTVMWIISIIWQKKS